MACARVLVFLLALLAVPAIAQDLTIENVTVIDGTGGPALPGRTVTIKAGRIETIGPAGARSSGTVIDGRGKFLIPGLSDVHVHIPGNGDHTVAMRALHSYLYVGVTTVFDSGNNASFIIGLRDDERANKILSPRLFSSAANIAYPSGWGASGAAVLVDAWPEDMAAVDANLALKPDIQKLHYEHHGTCAECEGKSFTPELFTQIIAHIKSRGFRTTIHLSDDAHARTALAAGVDVWAPPVMFAPMSPELPVMVAAKGVTVASTISVFDDIVKIIDDPAYLERPALRAMLTPAEIDQLKTSGRNRFVSRGYGPWFRDNIGHASRSVKGLFDAGVPIAIGTDRAMGPLTIRELELVVAAGVPPAQAIKAATLNAARYLARDNDLGTIAPGKLADLVLLDADPLADIANVNRIARVFKGGVEIDRRALLLPVNGR